MTYLINQESIVKKKNTKLSRDLHYFYWIKKYIKIGIKSSLFRIFTNENAYCAILMTSSVLLGTQRVVRTLRRPVLRNRRCADFLIDPFVTLYMMIY
jgi:hypothetical protein